MGVCFLVSGISFLVAQEDNTELKKAVQLFEDNEILEATRIFLNYQENPQALYYLGRIYSENLGKLPSRREEGFEFYRQSAARGYTSAKTKLALYFLAGEFVKQNFKKAVFLLKDASKQKDKEAQLILDSLYFGGYLKDKDLEKIPEENVWKTQRVEKNKKCLQIFSIDLKGNSEKFKTKKFYSIFLKYLFRCLRSGDIERLKLDIHLFYSQKGYVAFAFQKKSDLKNGEIIVEIVEGKIHKITIGDGKGRNKSRKVMAFAKQEGKFLNDNALAQGLEQINRLRYSRAALSYEPAEEKSYSNINVFLEKEKYFHLNLGITPLAKNSPYGSYSYSLRATLEDIFGLNESIAYTYGRASEHSNSLFNRSHSMNFSVPYGYWNFSHSYSDNVYSQEQMTDIQTLTFKGDSLSRTWSIQRVLHRRKQNKYTLKADVIVRENRAFVNDTFFDVSSRRLTTAQYSLIRNWKDWQITSSYKQGLTLWGGREDATGIRDDEPHAQFNLYAVGLSYTYPSSNSFDWFMRFYAQQADRDVFETISIGGNGSVRGYSSNSFSDDVGGYLQNTFSINFIPFNRTSLKTSLFYDYGCVESSFGDKNHRCNFSWKAFSFFYSYEVPISFSKPFTTEESIVRRISASLGFAF